MSDKKKVFIAVPAYDGKIVALGMVSILNCIKNLELHDVESVLELQIGDPYIEMARNHLVKKFLSSDCTDMLFVDNDLAFDGDGMWKLIRQDVSIVGGGYPYRAQEVNDFAISIKLDANNFPIADEGKGLIECNYIPTGFMRIRRDVFDVLGKNYPTHVDNNGEILHFRTGFLGNNDNNRWWGEDVYFCKICNDSGIKVWVDPSISFVHHGTLFKSGNYQQFLANGGKG
jgi:hypothetical protein